MNEKEIVRLIRDAFPRKSAAIGIGDDAAIVDLGSEAVVTTDTLVENVDFTREIPLRFIAEKALAVNLSDLASMGARATFFTLTIGANDWVLESIEEVIRALSASASEYEVELIGGDLSRASDAFLSITAFGRLDHRALLRSDAKPGHRLFLSRAIGGSTAGLALIRKGWRLSRDGEVIPPAGAKATFDRRAFAEASLKMHMSPTPEVSLGRALGGIPTVGACIDVSDGLSTDLARVCQASKVGAVIEWERIPVFDGLDEVGGLVDSDDATLNGGEELALLFSADARESELSRQAGRPVYQIGFVTREPELLLERNGVRSELRPGGWDHFE